MKAVLFIIFNRPNTAQKVFDAIQKAQPPRLYIAADAPRTGNAADEEKCRTSRTITEVINWPCEVKRLYQQTNLGCSLGPRAAFNWFFSQEQEGIILEDDCVPHPDFFTFAETMLDQFRENKKIISINGSNLGYKLKDGNSYTFSRYMNMWGWATWADRATAIDYSLESWKEVKHPVRLLYKKMRQHVFDKDINWYRYWKHKFDLTITEETITWWDWQWVWHQTLHGQLSVVPAANLVSNIGFHDDATHTKHVGNPAANVCLSSMHFPLKHPSSITVDTVYEEKFVKEKWCSYKRVPFMFYIKTFLKRKKGILKLALEKIY